MPTFPIHDPVLIFSLVMLMVLIAPLLMEKIRLPGIIGLIIAGVLLGPHLFGILERDRTIDLLGTIGLLYIMFQAGLEINLDQVKKNRRAVAIFTLLTFSLPLIAGIAGGRYLLGMNMPAAVLLASMFAFHTLITFPIVSRMGLSNKRSVITAVGGTIITSILSLLIMAVIISIHQGELTPAFFAKLGASITLYTIIMLYAMPKIASWFFKRFSSEDGSKEFVFIITAFFIAAYFSDIAGMEPIIGAFLAGLTLNPLIPDKSVLMNRVKFVGNSLFIPFFLISVGMLINPGLFVGDPFALKAALAMILLVVFSKYLAAHIFGKTVRYSKSERDLVFGLSVNHAAFTLATAMIGYRTGIFNEAILGGSVAMIIATCFLGSVVTQRSSKKIIRETSDSRDYSKPSITERILVPVKNERSLNNLMDLAFLLHPRNSDEPLYPLHIAMEGTDEERQIIEGEKILTMALTRANAMQKQIVPLTRIDLNVSSAIQKAIKEHRISIVILGWNEPESFTYTFFDTVMEQLVKQSHEIIFISRIIKPLNITQRVFLIIPPLINRQNGFRDTFKTLVKLASAISAGLFIVSEETTRGEISGLIPVTSGSPVGFVTVTSWKSIVADLGDSVSPEDLIMQMIARQGRPAWRLFFDRMPYRIKQSFPGNNIIAVYPYHHMEEFGEPQESQTGKLSLLKRIPEGNYFLNTGERDPQTIFETITRAGSFENRRVVYQQLLSVLNEYPIELTRDIVLIHIHTNQVDDYRIYLAVSNSGFVIPGIDSTPRLLVILLSPEDQPVQNHLNILSEISGMMMMDSFVSAILKAKDYGELLRLIETEK